MFAHELFHTYQFLLLYGAPFRDPSWSVEGVADFFAFKAMDAGGVLPFEVARSTILVPEAKEVNRSLKEMATSGEYEGVPYAYFILAVELLVSKVGEESLVRLYLLMQQGATWQAAFQEAFGMTVDEFYELFEEHRAADFPELE